MKRFLAITAAFAFFAAPNFAAPGGRKNKNRAAAPVPAAAQAPSQPSASKPPELDLSSPWRTWSDPSGNKIEAAFCALQGDVCTVQTKAGQTHRLNLGLLVPADRQFATAYAAKLNENRFKDAYVKQAAFQVDHFIGSTLVGSGQKFNPPATDEQFLRRIFLDTVGRIPTADEAAAFLKDPAPDKRAKLIDALLDSPGYTMHMYNWLADILRVKDDIGKGAFAFLFQDWLKDQLAADRPWDKMVSDMLTADGRLCETGAAGFLLRDAQMPLDGVANMLTTFLGANVACAQCHDHPLASWTQRNFYEMAAFFGASDGYDQDGFKRARRLSSGKGGATGLDKRQVQQIAGSNVFRIVDTGKQSLHIPKDYKYDDIKPGTLLEPKLITWSAADKNNPAYKINTGDPRTLRDEFARWMTSPENPRFATNIANRLWKKCFGLAVQEPVSDLDDPKDSGNPQLLAHLTQIMKAARFDMRQFQRVIFNSQTYQRAAIPMPDLEKGPYLFPGPIIRRMTAEQVWDSILALSAGTAPDNILLRRGDEMHLLALPGNAMTAEAFKVVIDRVRASGIQMGGYGGKKKGSGGVAGKNLLARYEGGKPQQREGMLLARASELPQPAPESHFLRVFGQSDRLVAESNENDGSVPQALMLMNSNVAGFVSDPNAFAVARADSAKTADEKIESLYLGFLSRKPTAEERGIARKAIESGLATTDLAWTLLNTREFLFLQ